MLNALGIYFSNILKGHVAPLLSTTFPQNEEYRRALWQQSLTLYSEQMTNLKKSIKKLMQTLLIICTFLINILAQLPAQKSKEKRQKMQKVVNTPPAIIYAIDPICKMKVSKTSKHSHNHNKIEYSFCSSMCKERFKSNPEKYTVK